MICTNMHETCIPCNKSAKYSFNILEVKMVIVEKRLDELQAYYNNPRNADGRKGGAGA